MVNEKLDGYLFDIPDAVIGISHEEVIVSGETQVHITWTNPQQKCAAFDFYQIHDDGSWANNLYQPYYVDTNGLQTGNGAIWQTIKRSMNKLPFHEFLRVQYLSFNPNTNFTPNAAGWQDLGGAQIVGGTGTATSTANGTRTLYPIFKDITKIVVKNDGTVASPSLSTGLTTQDILMPSSGTRCYINKNVLDAQVVYRFRVALDNRACLNGKEFGDPDRDDELESLNWQVVPSDGTYIELGSYGPAPAPSNIQFVTGEEPFEPTSSSTNYSGTITGSAGFDASGNNQVMDLSFNTGFPGPANIAVQYGFDVSGNILNSSKQVGSRSFTGSIPQQFRYANENSFTFTSKDLSFNTTPAITAKGVGGITTASFNIDLDTTLSGWNKTTNFQTNFPHGIALPEHVYDVSNVYMANNQFDSGSSFPFKAVAEKHVVGGYGGNFPQTSGYASRDETSLAVFGLNNLMRPFTSQKLSSVISPTPGYIIHMSNPPDNYGTTTELKKVRQGDNHNVIYGIFIAPNTNVDISFNLPGFSSASNFTNKNITNFITCPHGQGSSIIAGSDIINQQIASYDLKYEYYDTTGTLQNPITSQIPINGYSGTFPVVSTSTTTLLTLTLENDDPTGNTSSTISRLNQQFGGYYNIQKILNATGINGINTTNTGDTADSAIGYKKYILELTQTIPASVSDSGILEQPIKQIEFYLGHAPQSNITAASPASVVGIPASPGITTNLALFGIVMPNVSLNFELPSVQIQNINTKWIWADENLFDFRLFYNNGSTFDELDNVLADWNNPVTITQTNTFVGTESVGTSANFRQDYPYSRNGAEGALTSSGGATSNAQFKITLIVKNNVFATTTGGSPTEFDFDYYSNEGNTKWNWGSQPHIIWWDYTYAVLTAGTGVTSGPDSNFEGLCLKDSRGIGTQTQSAGGNTYLRNWPGLNFTTSGTNPSTLHEWYNNKYDHTHSANPPSLDDHQLIWAAGGFRGGYAAGGTGSNVLNPYIDYGIYFRNSSNYSSKGSAGESWNYDATWASNFAGGTYYDGTISWSISGDYKFIMLEDDSQNWANSKSVEFYVNGSNISNSLTLGDDYILYICLEGDAYNSSTYSSVAGRVTFNDSGGNTKYRTGWFDCQLQASTSNITLQNGKGCFMASNSNVISSGNVLKYQFILYGAEINNGSDVRKIYYRLGIKNDSNQLSSSTYGNDDNSIVSIKIQYSPEGNQ